MSIIKVADLGISSGVNTPAFEVQLATTQTLSVTTTVDMEFTNEIFDTNNCFNTTTKIFQPTVAGKYFVYFNAKINHSGDDLGRAIFTIVDENSNTKLIADDEARTINLIERRTTNCCGIIDMNGTTNTLKARVSAEQLGTGNITISDTANFGAYRLIGV